MSFERHAARQLLCQLAGLAGLFAFALPASADQLTTDLKFESNISIATDYRFRGFTQTREGPAVQGGFDVFYRSLYFGMWSSNVDFGRIPDAFGRPHQTADFEVELYGGVKNKFRGVELDLGLIYYSYPGSYGIPNDLNYFEAKAGISGELHPLLTGGLTVYYSPDYFGESGTNWIFEGYLKRALGKFAGVEPFLSATLAYSAGEESKGGFDYWYWNAGVSFTFADYFELDLRYYDTIDVPSSIDCSNRCDGRFVARLAFEY